MPATFMLTAAVAGAILAPPPSCSAAVRPGCANDINLRAMLADPRDMEQGRPITRSDAAVEVKAVERLQQDDVKALKASGLAGPGQVIPQ